MNRDEFLSFYMNKMKEYDAEAKVNRKKYQAELIKNNYALSEIGTIIEDHIGKIKVEQVKLVYDGMSGLLWPAYVGVMIKKNGQPFKSGEIRSVWDLNIKRENGGEPCR